MTKPHKYKDAIIAWANGETIQFWWGDRYGWLDVLEPNFNSDTKFRVKPEIILINGIEVPSPVRRELSEGTRYYIPQLMSAELYNWDEWSDEPMDKRALSRGTVHLTKEAAMQHAKALLSFTDK